MLRVQDGQEGVIGLYIARKPDFVPVVDPNAGFVQEVSVAGFGQQGELRIGSED